MVTRAILITLLFLNVQGCTSPSTAGFYSVDIGGELFSLELMIDQPTRTNGMMLRSSFPEHGGMLFVFTDATKRTFWMKNCIIDIDLIYLDSRGTITTLYQMTIEPPQGENESEWLYEGRLQHYWSNGPIRYAIELEAGTIERLQLHVNDQIYLDLPYLNSLAR